MITQETKIKINKEKRDYLFYCENVSPLGEVYDALGQMREHVLKIMSERQEEKNEDPKKKKEPEKEE